MVENDYVKGSLVVALNAGFGSGKTTFIEMWRNSLLARREAGEFVPMPVVLNAWENDHCGDPLLAILAGLVEVIDKWEGNDKPDKSRLKEAAKDVLWFAAALTNEVASKVGLDAMKAGKVTEEKKAERKDP